MNSKQAFNELYDLIEYLTRIDYVPEDLRREVKETLIDAYKKTNGLCAVIKKDLEVLYILKKCFGKDKYNYKMDLVKSLCDDEITEEEALKVKEWLENER